MISWGGPRSQQWRSEGLSGFLITTPNLRVPRPQREKGVLKMKAFVMMAAVFTSALLTVPTVTEVGEAKVTEFRLNA